MITLEDIKNNEEVKELVIHSQRQLDELGYTEHGLRHAGIVSYRAGEILEALGFSEEEIELAKIAGFLHDIGNCINRVDHAHTGAILAFNLLKDMGMDSKSRTEILMAIGNHDENTGMAISNISAALILADKSDVHRDRVAKTDISIFDIHDRVNYAVTSANIKLINVGDKSLPTTERKIQLDLTIDTGICPVLDYFQIFLDRTLMSKYAAKYLGIWYEIIINGTRLL